MGATPILFKFFKTLSDRNNITLQYTKKADYQAGLLSITNFKTISLQPFQQADAPNPERFLQIPLSKDLALYNLLTNHQAT
ncbi:hypothetical protein Xedl_00232 [Xenorhabdus eapokensis]|uniref:Uncharacterized protein n=1 Tax=Xenorhabdus eapokensis TaxID=1873482 RepID=A0A1Q5TZW3_9GAMM|nr:hypothetical protein Xedl_00232 [Xenorhabdus eapokensis]